MSPAFRLLDHRSPAIRPMASRVIQLKFELAISEIATETNFSILTKLSLVRNILTEKEVN